MGDLKGPAKVDWIGLKAAAILLKSVHAAAKRAASSLPDYQQQRFVERVCKRACRERWLADPLTDTAKHAHINKAAVQKDKSMDNKPHHADVLNDGIRETLDHAKCNALSIDVLKPLTGQEIITGSVLSKHEKLAYLAQVVRTPLSEVSKDSILCSEHTVTDDGKGGGSVKVKKPDPLKAIELSAKLQGELSGGEDGTTLAIQINIG